MNRNTRTVFCAGETVYDLILRNGVPVSGTPGGSMLNTAVSLARGGVPVQLITDFGNDQVGVFIDNFLTANGVGTDHVDRFSDGKTALALAFLDSRRQAEYSFYKHFPSERLTIRWPLLQEEDILLFGSFYVLTMDIRKKLIPFIRESRERGATILYDPNFRREHLRELEQLRPLILENIALADLVRGSDEDFRYIFNAGDGREAFSRVSEAGAKILIYTRNKDSVELYTRDNIRSYPVPPIEPVSTIGAGDNFNAGVIYSMIHGGICRSELGKIKQEQWDGIIRSGISFSANVCLRSDNYIDKASGDSLRYP